MDNSDAPPGSARPSRRFSYEEAFARNLGWVTEEEQAKLRRSRVCIAGLGGVGGIYLLTLARLGIGSFTIADFDTFSYANFNRQVGATTSTLNKRKLDVMVQMARDINPELDIRTFPEGVTEANLDAFLACGAASSRNARRRRSRPSPSPHSAWARRC
jgi:tRNA A37 threonylcarbamoyladenosine dehydratase